MTILPTLIQSVARPPRDGKQPGSERTLPSEPVQAAPFPQSSDGESAIEHADSEHPSAEHVSPPASQAILGSARANVGEHYVNPRTYTQTFEDHTGKTSLAAREGEKPLHLISIPQASSSQATAGNSASIAHDLGDLPPLFDPAFLAAWRETQAQPTDAEPRRS